ncbi:MAG: ASCH domain-containing protein [Planctomycetaceae bacterium]
MNTPRRCDSSINHPDREMIALGIRQPWVELILRGVKTIEVRSQATRRRGTIYLYASQQISPLAGTHSVERHDLDLSSLPRGLLIGTAEILDCRPCTPSDSAAACVPPSFLQDQYAWMLGNPQRLASPLPVRYLPYGVWFYPFQRKGEKANRKRTS